MRVTRVQHTCFVFETAGGRIAVDPALDYFGNLWSPRGRNRTASRILSGIDAVVITHAHSDHFNIPTLLHFDRGIPVVLPAGDLLEDLPMADELADYGFRNVIQISAGESVELFGVTVTSVPSPDSIEGIAQQSLLVERGGLRILHGADTLEDYGTLAELAGQAPVQLALMPLNCSLNYRNLRNQMSPGTYLEAMRVLRPGAVVPLGVNEAPRRGILATDAPLFPHGEALFRDPAFVKAHLDATRLLPMEDGQSILVTADGPVGEPEPLPDSPDSGSADVEIALGRLWALLLDVHHRDRHYFSFRVTRTHAQWRDAWLECRSRLEELLADWDEVLRGAVRGLPAARLTAPVLRWFPTTVRTLTEQGEDPGQLVLDSLWLLEEATTEHAYAQALFHLLAARVRSDPAALWRCRVEFSSMLVRVLERRRAVALREFSEEDGDRWIRRQAAAELKAAGYVFPRLNPVFGPFDVTGAAYLGLDAADTGRRLALHTLRGDAGNARSVVTVLQGGDAELAAAIVEADGAASIEELCERLGLTHDDFERFYLRLAAFDPYCLETHWYPGEALAWRPDYRA